MDSQNAFATIVAYYLSRFDREAYERLGFGNMTATHKAIGRILDVKPNYVKNRRDEFDPLHDNPRVGWYQRPLAPACVRVHEMFQDLDEQTLRGIVEDILNDPAYRQAGDIKEVLSHIKSGERTADNSSVVARLRTGRLAEDFFIQHHRSTGRPATGTLRDTRNLACGYDFEIETASGGSIYVEVKGIAGDSGGIQFTDREWRTAKEKGDLYFLALVRIFNGTATIGLIQNPAAVLHPQRRLYTTVQISWSVSPHQLQN